MATLPETFRCYLVDKDSNGNVAARITERRVDELPHGDVLIRVDFSSLNYKDALAAKGHPGVAKTFPLVAGVDAAGTVVRSGVYEFVEGDQVLVTGFDMGVTHWGGFAEYVSVPQDWVVPMPSTLTPQSSMMLGTAGLTAALCVDALRKHEISPDRGQIVVTGASGGVGSLAVAILAKLGYRVAAVTGKDSARDYLESLGAAEVLSRAAVTEESNKSLLSGRWAGGVDTVGGNILSTVLRATRHFGCVAACGNAGGHELPITVYPFILRGVTLTGVDAAMCPLPVRHAMWEHLGDDWRIDRLSEIARLVELEDLPSRIDDILAGRVRGRVAVAIGGSVEQSDGQQRVVG